jgi:hypothetical protein
MAYSAPKQWSHGDAVTATHMNKYRDSLNAIYAKIGDSNYNFAVPHGMSGIFVHRFRWLHYSNSGVLMDINGSEDSMVNLSGDENEFDVYDLESVPWLQYGMMYRVDNCDMCCESSET